MACASPLSSCLSPSNPPSDHNSRVPDSPFAAVRGIYFDLDDTLCGYWNASKAGLRAAFGAHPVPGVETEEAIAGWARAFRTFSPTLKATGLYQIYLKSGETTRTEQMRLALEQFGIDDRDHAARLSHAYMTERDRNLKLFPDAIEVLTTLKKKYPLGLITNGPADIQRQEVATTGVEPFLDHIFIEGEMGEGKPLKSVFDRAAVAMNLQPHELLMVGNSYSHDIVPAVRDGWRTAWIRRDSDVPPSADVAARGAVEPIPTSGPMPDLIIENLSELLPLL